MPTVEMDLTHIPTKALRAEIERRNRFPVPQPRQYCDDCQFFVQADARCQRGHHMTFHLPDDWRETMEGDWGWHRRNCTDRTRKPNEEVPNA